ncbi:unnamed protein product [Clonostachys rosea]|uniref:F-box domain-containing protein n=1 Tax=Bionectria ochroleuca TaxID=29856 RepID=A0ABY6UV02_BIOOC|nr:unnamed protein product [Clonostachys rosea]
MMESNGQLSTLAPEILDQIFEYAHASCHWPLAQSCKHVYHFSKPILQRHKLAHKKYRVASDLHPWTLITLLRSAFCHDSASIDAWHVREFEGYWMPWVVHSQTGRVLRGRHTGHQILDEVAIRYFLDKITLDLPPIAGNGERDHERAFNDSALGRDGFLKALLLAYLPRLKALRFAEKDSDEYSSLVWLSKMIYWCKEIGRWLPGLEALEKVAVGIAIRPSGGLGVPDDQYKPLHQLHALTCLPQVSEIYFSNVERDLRQGPLRTSDSVMLEGNSSLQTMILDMPRPLMDNLLVDLISKLPRSLRTLVIRGEPGEIPLRQDHFERLRILGRAPDPIRSFQEDIGNLMRELVLYQGRSLQRLLLYSSYDASNRARFSRHGPDKMRGLRNLRVANVLLDDIEETLSPVGTGQTQIERLDQFARVLRDGFPRRIEVLAFWQNNDSSFQTGENGSDAELDYLDDALMVMIQSEEYRNLKVIYLDDIQVRNLEKGRTNVDFPKAVQAGDELGVHVHTLGRTAPEHSPESQFVAMPDKYDMVTGPFGKRDGSLVFNKFNGSFSRPRWEGMEGLD